MRLDRVTTPDQALIRISGVILLGYFFLRLLSWQNGIFFDSPIPLLPGFLVALGLLFGPLAAVAVGAGHVAADLITGSLAVDTSVGFLTEVLLVITAHQLWGRFGIFSSSERPGMWSVRNFFEYILTAVTATAFVTSLGAWVSLILNLRRFWPTIAVSVPEVLVSGLTVGPFVLYVSRPVIMEARRVRQALTTETKTETRRWGGVIIGILASGWIVAGSLVNIVFRAIEQKYPQLFINRYGRLVEPILDIAGPAGMHLQVVLGGVCLFFCVYILVER